MFLGTLPSLHCNLYIVISNATGTFATCTTHYKSKMKILFLKNIFALLCTHTTFKRINNSSNLSQGGLVKDLFVLFLLFRVSFLLWRRHR